MPGRFELAGPRAKIGHRLIAADVLLHSRKTADNLLEPSLTLFSPQSRLHFQWRKSTEVLETGLTDLWANGMHPHHIAMLPISRSTSGNLISFSFFAIVLNPVSRWHQEIRQNNVRGKKINNITKRDCGQHYSAWRKIHCLSDGKYHIL